MKASKGDWVEISQVVLEPGERAPNLPPDTAAERYTLRARGFAISEADTGSDISIRTFAGRTLTGRLEEVNPEFHLSHGESVPELVRLRFELEEMARKPK